MRVRPLQPLRPPPPPQHPPHRRRPCLLLAPIYSHRLDLLIKRLEKLKARN
ncbi:hypothetical protein RHGRI_029595 [Rhododendron griersonianum]|uniref:Uncharacterized protein n=1 Tax=Rhododendron griersonianum TaxID=479676 RepID=A0AAV6IK28_9ERIC|nr:hypothetical protein RHGRI_029595 [Rhododendron griersonianum]